MSKTEKQSKKLTDNLETKFVSDKGYFSWGYQVTNIDFMADVTDETAQDFLTKIRAFSTETQEDINLFINTRGGVCTALTAILDGMELVENDFCTIGIGQCASCGAVLLSAGTKGKRFITPNARVLIHQVRGGALGVNSEVQVGAQEMDRLNELMFGILAKNCGKTVEELKQLTLGADLVLTAQEAVDFGIVDGILTKELIKNMHLKDIDPVNNEEAVEFEAELEPSNIIDPEIKGSKDYSHSALKLEIKGVIEDEEFYYIEASASTPEVDRVGDIVLPEAFVKSVERIGNPAFIHQHNLKEMPLGVTDKVSQVIIKGQNNTLVSLRMPKDDYSEKIKVRAEMGAYGGLSIGYVARDWTFNGEGVRVISDLDWYEVSLVTVPVNPSAKIFQVKQQEMQEKTKSANVKDVQDMRSAEKFLRAYGVSKTDAGIFLKAIKSTITGEPEVDESVLGEPAQTKQEDVEALVELLNVMKQTTRKD